MKVQKIKYQEGWLYVDKKAKIINGDTFLTDDNRIEICAEDWNAREWHRKIVAQSPNLSLPNIPYIEEVEEDIEKLAMDELKNKWAHLYLFGYPKRPFPTNYENDLNNVMIGYYKAAQSKGGYSEADIEKAIQFGIDITAKHTTPTYGTNFDKVEDDKNTYIQSLNQPKESIEIEMYNGNTNEPIQYLKDGKTFLKVKQ